MLLSALAASFMAVCVRYLSEHWSITQIAFFRSLFGAIMLLGGLRTVGKAFFRVTHPGLLTLRCVFGALGMAAWFYCLAVVPLPVASALSFLWPVFVALLAMWVLKERYSGHYWWALLAAFAGALVIIRPGTQMFESGSLLVVGTMVIWALATLFLKKVLQRGMAVASVVFYFNASACLLMAPFAFWMWQDVTWPLMMMALVIALLGNATNICLCKALALEEMGNVMPFDFFRLLFVGVLAWFFFAEKMDIATAVGAAIILASAVYIVRHTVRGKKEQQQVMQDPPYD